ncbi:MAG: polyhydroxyalkanoate depolymerase, partial [Leptothrix sp. (in: b-proteobacteria)]
MLYHAYQALSDSLTPWQQMAAWSSRQLDQAMTRVSHWPEVPGAREWMAACEVFSRLRLTHERPGFGIDTVTVGEGVEGVGGSEARQVAVTEHVIQRSAFGTLLRFERADAAALAAAGQPLPRVLIVAPLSGHFATLLADTARTMLADHDVYITDWHNARMVPLSEGRFGLAEYVDHVIGFIDTLGPGVHLLAVCQPCVPVLAAVALMAQRGHAAQPRSMTLMAGPIDTRVNPTAVNELANSKPIEWF